MKRVQLFFDRLLNELFNGGTCSIMNTYPNGQPMEEHYKRFGSMRIGVLSNKFVSIGGYQEVVYTFSEDGTVTSRRRLKDIFKEKGKLVIGDSAVNDLYRANEREKVIDRLLALPGDITIA